MDCSITLLTAIVGSVASLFILLIVSLHKARRTWFQSNVRRNIVVGVSNLEIASRLSCALRKLDLPFLTTTDIHQFKALRFISETIILYVQDDLDSLFPWCDFIVTVGDVSVGKFQFVKLSDIAQLDDQTSDFWRRFYGLLSGVVELKKIAQPHLAKYRSQDSIRDLIADGLEVSSKNKK